jgi:hypothetical protein
MEHVTEPRRKAPPRPKTPSSGPFAVALSILGLLVLVLILVRLDAQLFSDTGLVLTS